MTSRERMLAAIKRENTDHVPLSMYIGNWAYFGDPLMWNDQIERAERLLGLGADPTFDIWMPDPQPGKEVQVKSWREKKGDEILITKEYHTPAGILRQVVRETDDWCTTRHGPWIPTTWGSEKRDHFGIDLFDDWNISRRIEPWVKSRKDLEKLRYIIRPIEGHILDEWRMDAERVMEYADRMGLLTVARRTIVGDAHQWFCDIPWFMIQLFEDTEFVTEFFSIFQEWSTKLVEMCLDIGVDVIQYRGWYEIPTFWGPQFWKEFIGPCIEEQADITHQAGKLLTYLLPRGHEAYADVLKETQIDVCQGIDPLNLGGGNLNDLYGKLGGRKAFWGGVNAEVTLESQDYGRIECEVKEAVEVLNKSGGLILSSFIFEESPLQGTLNFIKAWKKVCGLE